MADTNITEEQLLVELEDLLRTMPPRATMRHATDENFSWQGRASAIIEQWNGLKIPLFTHSLSKFNNMMAREADEGQREMMVMLHQARNDLKMRTGRATNTAIGHGMEFEYFDVIRKTIELASKEVFFVDPYLDADFVSRYLPHIREGVIIRLLTSDKKLGTLLPAIDLFAKQDSKVISVRSANGFHDRYVFIDKENCYQSGASFKDGARVAPTTITQITDAFGAVRNTYEEIWTAAKVERGI